tara:strand:+ start:550 stop:4815 length:4266 start_codon:yes stop_codon:yes gene_type:complete
MPEIKNVFTSGKMNKDLDERLIPNDQYRDALNIQVSNSEGADVGAIENILGNSLKNNSSYNESTGTYTVYDFTNNPKFDHYGFTINPADVRTIGVIRHDKTECIYWFVTSSSTDAIIEYNQSTDVVSPVLVDKNNVLNFSKQKLITGINIIDGLLFFTDDNSEPKCVNIKRFREASAASSNGFQAHTEIYGRDFIEEDVTTAKKSPLTALNLDVAASKYGNQVPGTGVTPVTTSFITSGLQNFTFIPDTVNAAGDTESMPTHGQYEDNIAADSNYYQNSNLPANFGDGLDIVLSSSVQGDDSTVWHSGDIVILSGSYTNEYNESYSYEIRALIVFASNVVARIKILAISADIQVFPNPVIWEVLLEEKEPMFEYVFPRFAYRWKYQDNQYSTFSPFSQVAFIGDDFKYVSTDGHNEGMSNNIRKLKLKDITWGSPEVVEVDILYKESNSNNIYKVETLKKSDYTNTNGSFITEFEITSEIFSTVIETNQLLRPWDSVPRKAKAQEIVANRLIYANYLHNYNVDPIAINAQAFSQPHPDVDPDSIVNNPKSSIKSMRKYQTGIVFKDKYGRETPVVTDKTAGVEFPIINSQDLNKIEVKPTGDAPDWATHYKVFVKDISNEYYNLALDRYYSAEDGNVWLSFPSSERNKVTEDTYLILKKQHATSVSVKEVVKFKVLSISNEAPTFIKRRNKAVGRADVTLIASSQPQQGSTFFKFQGPTAEANPNFANSFSSNASLRISHGANSTDVYAIQSGGPTGSNNEYSVAIDEPLGNETSFLDPLDENSTGITIVLFEEEDKVLPEHSGRFFVKINRNSGFEKNIIDTYPSVEQEYGIKNSFSVLSHKNQGNSDSSQDAVWRDFGNTSGSSSRRKPHGDQCPWKYPGECSDKKKFTVMVHGLHRDDRNDPTKWLGGAMAELDNVGTLIRFADANGVTGKIYTIADVTREFKRRGMRSSNSNYDNFSNGRNQWNITLEENYQDFDKFTNRTGNNPITQIQILEKVFVEDNKTLSSFNPAVFETEPKEAIDLDIYYEASDAKPISEFNNVLRLKYHNIFSFGNGVESNRIRDDFNAVTIDKGVKASSIIDEPYEEERRPNGLIFSQIFNSISGVNRLNQFIIAEPITKDLNPAYGSIQKLHARDTDLITLCEDKCLKILANKDALFNADGNANVTSNQAVLGQSVPFVGEYGISTNPESFATYGFRAFFADKNRGVVLRLSRNGLQEISAQGMSDYFKDKMSTATEIVGSYDDYSNCYNLSFRGDETVSYKQGLEGWPTRKSFVPEAGVSLNNTYYTIQGSRIWSHDNPLRNTFYGNAAVKSSVKLIFNAQPSNAKNFKTINYEGDSGWTTPNIVTDQQDGKVTSYIEKEGMYYNYIQGKLNTWNSTTQAGSLDTSEFSTQGIGNLLSSAGAGSSQLRFTLTIAENND